MKKILFSISILFGLNAFAQVMPTTTVVGSMKITDSLNVTNDIQTAGDVSATGNITATGEVTAQDTMRAQKDLIVDGNAKIAGSNTVLGHTNLLGGLTVLNLNQATALTDPCNLMTMVVEGTTGNILTVSAAAAVHLEDLVSAGPCPPVGPGATPVVPFTWQTLGNHVGNDERWLGTHENYDFNIRTNGIKRATFKKSGLIDFVGPVNIGTLFATATPYMLTVNGRIGAREIKVSIQNPWPDYVFNKNYKLQSLENIEIYVNKYKHLPNIPSGDDLKKEELSLDLAQMQGLQMEKIEELYLHLIQLNKDIKELKKENDVLKTLIKNKN